MYEELDDRLIEELVHRVKAGEREAEEELYLRLYASLQQYAIVCANQYYRYGLDSEDFTYAFYGATKRAIDNYESDKGIFIRFWRKVLKTEAARVVGSALRSMKNSNETKHVRYDVMEPWRQDIIFNSFEQPAEDYSTKEESARILTFVKEHYPIDEWHMFLGWLNGTSFKSLAKEYEITPKQVSSKVYNILAMVKRNFIH